MTADAPRPGPGGNGRAPRVALATGLVAIAVLVAVQLVAGRLYSGADLLVLLLALVAAFGIARALRGATRYRQEMSSLVARLNESDQRNARILSIAVDAIITVDELQHIVMFNQGAERIFGWTSGEVHGKPLSLLLPARHHEVHAGHVERFGRGPSEARHMGERQEIRGLRKDGTEFPAEASISRLQTGSGALYTVVLRDVTVRHRQQQDERFLASAGATLSASLDYESTLVSAVNLPVPHLADCCVLDVLADGKWRRVASVHESAGRTRTLRLLAEQSTPGTDWPFPVATVYARGTRIGRDGRPPGRESDGSGGAGVEALVAGLGIHGSLSVPVIGRGHTAGVMTYLWTDPGHFWDVERESLLLSVTRLIGLAIDNAALYHAARRATASRDEILSVVSHDLRNPLSAISMCASVLRSESTSSLTERAELVDAIGQSTELMERLIKDLLDVSVIESGHLRIDPQPQQVEPLTTRAVEMFRPAADERQVALRRQLPESLPPVRVDETRFLQALANLLDNAVKFTEAGGTVTLTVEPREEHALVSVRDTGPGIPPSHLPHVFDRHWHGRRTERRAGTGLGLAIARGIVEAHGGTIWVESGGGPPGSTFSFTVPFATPTNMPAKPRQRAAAGGG